MLSDAEKFEYVLYCANSSFAEKIDSGSFMRGLETANPKKFIEFMNLAFGNNNNAIKEEKVVTISKNEEKPIKFSYGLNQNYERLATDINKRFGRDIAYVNKNKTQTYISICGWKVTRHKTKYSKNDGVCYTKNFQPKSDRAILIDDIVKDFNRTFNGTTLSATSTDTTFRVVDSSGNICNFLNELDNINSIYFN